MMCGGRPRNCNVSLARVEIVIRPRGVCTSDGDAGTFWRGGLTNNKRQGLQSWAAHRKWFEKAERDNFFEKLKDERHTIIYWQSKEIWRQCLLWEIAVEKKVGDLQINLEDRENSDVRTRGIKMGSTSRSQRLCPTATGSVSNYADLKPAKAVSALQLKKRGCMATRRRVSPVSTTRRGLFSTPESVYNSTVRPFNFAPFWKYLNLICGDDNSESSFWPRPRPRELYILFPYFRICRNLPYRLRGKILQ